MCVELESRKMDRGKKKKKERKKKREENKMKRKEEKKHGNLERTRIRHTNRIKHCNSVYKFYKL